MNGYRDELEALRLRTQSLEATLREREAALQARDAQLREAEARAERNLRTGGAPRPPGFDEPPVAPKRTSAVTVLVVAVMALVTVGSIVAVFVFRSASTEANAQHARELAAVQEVAKREAERGAKAEKEREACEAKLSDTEDQITKRKLEAELGEARKAAPSPSKCGCAPGDLACNMACSIE